jgi:hypothetical protein
VIARVLAAVVIIALTPAVMLWTIWDDLVHPV